MDVSLGWFRTPPSQPLQRKKRNEASSTQSMDVVQMVCGIWGFSLADNFISIDTELTSSMSCSVKLFLYHLNWTLHHLFSLSLSEMFVQEETIFDPSSRKPPMPNMFAFESGYILQTCFGTKNLFSTLSRMETPDKPSLSDRCAHLRAHHVVVISAKNVTHFTSQ